MERSGRLRRKRLEGRKARIVMACAMEYERKEYSFLTIAKGLAKLGNIVSLGCPSGG